MALRNSTALNFNLHESSRFGLKFCMDYTVILIFLINQSIFINVYIGVKPVKLFQDLPLQFSLETNLKLTML